MKGGGSPVYRPGRKGKPAVSLRHSCKPGSFEPRHPRSNRINKMGRGMDDGRTDRSLGFHSPSFFSFAPDISSWRALSLSHGKGALYSRAMAAATPASRPAAAWALAPEETMGSDVEVAEGLATVG